MTDSARTLHIAVFIASGLLTCMMIAMGTGCAGADTTRIDYQTEIRSTPEAATVEDSRGALLGETPLTLDGQVDVTTRRSIRARTAIGVGLSWGALFSMAALPAYSTTRDDVFQDHELSKGPAIGLTITALLGFAAAGWGYFLSGSYDNVYLSAPDGAFDGRIMAGKRGDRDLEYFLRSLPESEFQLSTPGYATRTATPQLGESSSFRLESQPSDGTTVAGRDAVPRASGKSSPDVASSTQFITGAPQPNVHALVVGIEAYRNLSPTPGARGDAERFANMLQTSLGVPEENIQLLTDENATRSDILATLAHLKNTVPSDGRIYFYFSGHGTPNVETGHSFLLPYEGQPETLDFTGIAMDDLMRSLEETDARDVLAFVDSCFSGSGERSSLPEGTRPLVPVQESEPTSSVVLFASSQASEISGNAPDAEEGLFTRHLIRAIGEGRADIDGDGQISLAELKTYIGPRVSREARELNRSQTPTLSIADELGEPSDVILLWGLPRD